MLWGVPLTELRTKLTKAKQVVLLKFLRARDWHASQACDLLIQCLKVRRAPNAPIVLVLSQSWLSRTVSVTF